MSILDKFLAKIYAQNTPIEVPEEVTQEDIELIPEERKRKEVPFQVDVTKKRPHTIVPKDLIPEQILTVPELSEDLVPLADSIVDKWQQKEEIEREIKNRKKELDLAIRELKAERGYDLILKELEETTQKLGEALSNIDTESDVVLRRFKSWFTAVAQKIEDSPQTFLTDTAKLEHVKAWIKKFDSNLSRSVTMKLKWLDKKSTIVVEKVKRFVRIFPIEEKKLTRKGSKLIVAVEEELNNLLESAYDDAIGALSGLYQLEESIEDSISEINAF